MRAWSMDLQARQQVLREQSDAAREAGGPVRQQRTPPGPIPFGLGAATVAAHGETAQPLLLTERPQKEVDRWRAGEDRMAHFLDDGQVFLLAKPGAVLLEAFQRTKPTLLVQYFELPRSPLFTIVAVAGDSLAEEKTAQALYWLLDPGAQANWDLLTQLSRECSLHLDLFDDESRPMVTWQIQSPLAENIRYFLQRAETLLSNRRPQALDFAMAVQAYEQLGDERLGRKQHYFFQDSFQDLASPIAVRLALNTVSYWSGPENQEYLISVKSFPLPYWRVIRERVVRQAIDFGLRLDTALVDVALEQKVAPTKAALLQATVKNFTEVSQRIKPCDLDAKQEWENWQLLLADCAQHGIQVEAQMEDLAAAAGRRVGLTIADTNELREKDIIDQEEVLEDGDILDEEVEVQDEDILGPSEP